MGKPQSKTCKANNGEQINEEETGGFHLIEFHIPTAHMGLGIIIALLLLAVFAFGLIRWLRRKQLRKRSKQRTRAAYNKWDERVELGLGLPVDDDFENLRQRMGPYFRDGLHRWHNQRLQTDVCRLKRKCRQQQQQDEGRFQEVGSEDEVESVVSERALTKKGRKGGYKGGSIP